MFTLSKARLAESMFFSFLSSLRACLLAAAVEVFVKRERESGEREIFSSSLPLAALLPFFH